MGVLYCNLHCACTTNPEENITNIRFEYDPQKMFLLTFFNLIFMENWGTFLGSVHTRGIH